MIENFMKDFSKKIDEAVDEQKPVAVQTTLNFEVWDTGVEEKIWRNQAEPDMVWNNMN